MDTRMPQNPTGTAIPERVTLAAFFRYWLKLGLISFGGPAGQIAMMHQELVEKRRWISERRFLHALNYCMLLPGPEAQQLATYIGWLMYGVRGGIIAGTLFVLPSLFVLIALSWIYMAFGDVSEVQGALYGIKPAVIAIVAFAAWRIGARVLNNGVMWSLAAAAFVAIFVFDVAFPVIVLVAAVMGYFGGQIVPDKFRSGGGHTASSEHYGAALIDDHTPTPSHARFMMGRVVRYGVTGLLLWAALLGMLIVQFGWDGMLTQMGWFFTKAALLTFGGAYAVLPYLYQGGVEHYQWLTAPQMMDGLALGETTPGPLIMVVAFVGFVGAWSEALFGTDSLFLAGATGALVVTVFTFLPSFLFILVGGPMVEATHGDIKFTAPLAAITAAVVGVILNLALFFAFHVLWTNGVFDWKAAMIGIAAFVALSRLRLGVVQVIGACALIGWMMRLS